MNHDSPPQPEACDGDHADSHVPHDRTAREATHDGVDLDGARTVQFRCERVGFEASATDGALLGGFDGRDSREVHLYAMTSRPEQLLASMHEHLHHELHWSTVWGLTASMSGLLAGAGVDPDRLKAVAAAANAACRTVHEIFATTISAGALGVEDSRTLLRGNPQYLDFLKRGLRLGGTAEEAPWQFRESAAQMLLRSMMQPTDLLAVADGGFERIRVRDIAAPALAPDRRLEQVAGKAGGWWHDTFRALLDQFPDRGGDTGGTWSRTLPDDADQMDRLKTWEETVLIPALQDVATEQLRAAGFEVLNPAEYLDAVAMMQQSFERLAPDDWQIEVLTDRRAMRDEPLGAERESVVVHQARARIELHDGDALNTHAATFLFEPGHGSRHVLAAYLPARTMRRQFGAYTRDPADGPELHLLGRPHYDDTGQRVVPMAPLQPGITPAELAGMFPSVPTALLTTLTVTADRDLRQLVLDVDPALVLIDLPLRLQVDNWLETGWTLRFRVVGLHGGTDVNPVVFHLDELPAVWFLSLRSHAGFGELAQLLDAHPDTLHPGLDVPDRILGMLETATSWLLAAWWRFEEINADD